MRALVTGVTGYIGGRLQARLLNDGHTVTALVRGDVAGRVDSRASIARIDVGASLADIVGQAAPDVVFHVASAVVIEHSPDGIADIIQANLTFPTMLLDAMILHKVDRFVNTSTYSQHYDGGEDYRPANLYSATKQAFEDIARYYNDAHGMGIVNLKLFDVYGPADPRGKIVPLLLRVLRSGEPLGMSPGEQILDMIHVDDVVDAYLASAEWLSSKPGAWETFAVRSGQSHKLKDIVATLEAVSGETMPINWGARPYRSREMMTPWVGNTLVPGWSSRIPLAEGLLDVLREAALPVAGKPDTLMKQSPL